MFDFAVWRAFWVVLVFIAVAAALTISPSRNVSDQYTFELVDREVKQGSGTTVLVRLVDERTGKVVPDATLFISRLDMSPHGMDAMEAPLEPLPDTLPGYYRFETDLSMVGGWALTLAAKFPEADSIHRRLVLQAIQ